MASRSAFNITVTSNRGSSNVTAVSKGRYVSFPTNGINLNMPKQPILTTVSLKAYWLQVLAIVTAQVEALP
jgi:hypothetical protein